MPRRWRSIASRSTSVPLVPLLVGQAPACRPGAAASRCLPYDPNRRNIMSTTPTPDPKIGKYEFNAEENRTITQLADAMGVVATLMKVVGLIFLIFFGLLLY